MGAADLYFTGIMELLERVTVSDCDSGQSTRWLEAEQWQRRGVGSDLYVCMCFFLFFLSLVLLR